MFTKIFEALFENILGQINLRTYIPSFAISFLAYINEFPMDSSIYLIARFVCLVFIFSFVVMFLLHLLTYLIDKLTRFIFPSILRFSENKGNLLTRRIRREPYTTEYQEIITNMFGVYVDCTHYSFVLYFLLSFLKIFPIWVNYSIPILIFLVGIWNLLTHYLSRNVNINFRG